MKRRFFPSLCLLIGVLLIGLFGCTFSPTQDELLKLATGTGALEVQLGFPQRSVQARLSDIHHLAVTLQTPTGTSSQTVTQLTNSSASASVSFVELKPCDATLSITAFDAATQSIGVATTSATIEAQKVTHLNLNLTIVGNQIHVGNLVADASILDAPTPDNSVFVINSGDAYSLNGQAEHLVTLSAIGSSITIVNNTDQAFSLYIVPMEANGNFYGGEWQLCNPHASTPFSSYLSVPKLVIMTEEYGWISPYM